MTVPGTILQEKDLDTFRLRVERIDEYEIVVRPGSLGHLGENLAPIAEALDSSRVIIISDSTVADLYLPTMLRSLAASGLEGSHLVIPPGEQSKTIECATSIWHELQRLGLRRRNLLVALGGGVLCDLVGFVASTYMRGVPYVNVPTSLMAQVDGAIGGKVGVDHAVAKNLVGAFYHPTLVVVDPTTLQTLPRHEVACGLAEVVKVAIIRSPELFESLEGMANLPSSETLGEDARGVLESVIEDAIRIKLELLSHDPFERDLRRLLNLGHCVGHALESATRYREYRHGEAVSIGMSIASRVAAGRDVAGAGVVDRIVQLLTEFGLPTALPDHTEESVWEHLATINAIRNGRLNMVLPEEIGCCRIIDSITNDEYRKAAAASRARLVPSDAER